jgi:hypothetical protein
MCYPPLRIVRAAFHNYGNAAEPNVRKASVSLFSPTIRKKPGPKGTNHELMAAVVEMKQRNPTWGCTRIAQQIALAWDSDQQGCGAAHETSPDEHRQA